MAVTAKDVAEECGLSISTVSRALAEPERVAVATRERVVAAANRLGYHPNRAASGLRAGRTGVIGLVVPDLENPYFASIVKGVQNRARATGRASFVVDSGEDAHLEIELVRELKNQTDGIVLCSPRAVESDLEILGSRPVVLVNRVVEGQMSVTADNAAGMMLAVEHLRALGHRRIAYVGGPERSWSDEQRRAALHQAGENFADTDLVSVGSFLPHVEGGRAAADLVVAAGATAAIAYNDLMAVGLMDRLRTRGKRIPEDISVIGFDDTYVAQLTSPTLTSVRAGLVDIGARAVDELVLDLERRRLRTPASDPAAVELAVTLRVRDSTSVPPSAAR
ncbi:LacI family DNA-binding transcriptional regulator [Microbacterium sp. A82]|uniref:LacI family DNA-binding transcriptional regulator n=1 Tax=unclassified Microbacterium TaxID=2609290 RepID=UPI003F2AC5DA